MTKHQRKLSFLLVFVFLMQLLTSTGMFIEGTQKAFASQVQPNEFTAFTPSPVETDSMVSTGITPNQLSTMFPNNEQIQGNLTDNFSLPSLPPTPVFNVLPEDTQEQVKDTSESSVNQVKKSRSQQEIIVKYKDESKAEKVKKNLLDTKRISKLVSKKKTKKSKMETFEIGEGDSINKIIQDLKNDPNVEYAEPNYELKTFNTVQDPRFNEQWGLKNIGQTVGGQTGLAGKDINILPAWDITTGADSVVVGVLDTGIDINHPDLKNSIYINTKEIPNNGLDDDYNGFIDDINGWDFYSNDSTVFDSASNDTHATHVAGIIGALANTSGIRGVAPNVKILPLKFINGNTGFVADAIEAIEYASSMNIQIINCSWGGSENSLALKEVMENSGVLFVCSAGNYGANLGSSPVYPACYELSNILTVAATDNKGEITSFSNYGSQAHVSAPGTNVLSTLPGNNYGLLSGTSMAAPHIAGIAALLQSKEPALNSQAVSARIKNNVAVSDKLAGKVSTSGIADAYAVLINSASTPGEPAEGDNNSGDNGSQDNTGYDNTLVGNCKIAKPLMKNDNNYISGFNQTKLPEIASSKEGIQNLRMDKMKDNFLAITWTTNKKATTEIQFGKTKKLENSYKTDVLKNTHLVTLKVDNWSDLVFYKITSVTDDGDVYQTNIGEFKEIIKTSPSSNAANTTVPENSIQQAGQTQNVTAQNVTTLSYIYDNNTNHTIENAQQIPVGTVFGSMEEGQGSDFYSVSLEASKPYTFNLKGMASDEDYDLYLLNSSGGFILASTFISNYDETIDFVPSQSGTYYLQVLPYRISSGSAHHNYQMMVYPNDAAADSYEPNDGMSTASSITANTTISPTINVNSDEDWFSFNVSGLCDLKVTMQSVPTSCDYDMQLYKGNTLVGGSYAGSNLDELITYNATTPGKYHVRVYSYSGSNASSPYRLKVEKTGIVKMDVDKTSAEVGDIITATLSMSEISNFAGYQVNLKYDPTVIQPVKDDGMSYSNNTMPLKGNILLNNDYSPLFNANHELDKGVLGFSGCYLGLNEYKQSGPAETSGTLATVKFRVLSYNQIQLRFESSQAMPGITSGVGLCDWNSKIISTGYTLIQPPVINENLPVSSQATTLSSTQSTTDNVILLPGDLKSKVSGYIGVDFDTTATDIKQGFKVEVKGTVNGIAFSRHAFTDQNGYFEIKESGNAVVPSGVGYTIEITKGSYLKREIKDVDISADIVLGTQSTPVVMWAGDMLVDGAQDTAVNMMDIMEAAKAFNSIVGDARYTSTSNLDGDTAINMTDIMIIAKHFNMTPANYTEPLINIISRGPTYVSGEITQDTVWYAGRSPYIVQGTVTVPTGKTLTIMPGVVVKFKLNQYLDVGGKLVVEGKLGQEIIFTSEDDPQYGGDGEQTKRGLWGGIIADAPGEFYGNYFTVKRALRGIYTTGNFTVKNCEFSNISNVGITSSNKNEDVIFNKIENVTLRACGTGINFDYLQRNANFELENIHIYDSDYGIYINSVLFGSVNASISNTTIMNCGTGIYSWRNSITLINSTFRQCSTGIDNTYGKVVCDNVAIIDAASYYIKNTWGELLVANSHLYSTANNSHLYSMLVTPSTYGIMSKAYRTSVTNTVIENINGVGIQVDQVVEELLSGKIQLDNNIVQNNGMGISLMIQDQQLSIKGNEINSNYGYPISIRMENLCYSIFDGIQNNVFYNNKTIHSTSGAETYYDKIVLTGTNPNEIILRTNITLNKSDNSNYLLMGRIVIPDKITFKVNPGVVLEDGGYVIDIEKGGKLVVNESGAKDDPPIIYVIKSKDAKVPCSDGTYWTTQGYQGGIIVRNGVESSGQFICKYAKIKTGSDNYAINVDGGNLVMQNCEISPADAITTPYPKTILFNTTVVPTLKGNSFYGSIIENKMPVQMPIDATENYWGTDSGPEEITGVNTSGYLFSKDPVTLAINSNTSGDISFGGEVNTFTFTPSATKIYNISSSGDTDTYLEVYDSNNNLLAFCDDSKWDTNFYLDKELSANQTYRFKVTHFDRYFGTGEYSIKVSDNSIQGLNEDEIDLKSAAQESGGSYEVIGDSARVTVNGITATFSRINNSPNSTVVNGRIVMKIQDFNNLFFGTSISSQSTYESAIFIINSGSRSSSSAANIKKAQLVLMGLQCWVDPYGETSVRDASGVYGEHTVASLKKFQKDYMGIEEPTENLDLKTAEELSKYNCVRLNGNRSLKREGAHVRGYLEHFCKVKGTIGFIKVKGPNGTIIPRVTIDGKELNIQALSYYSDDGRCFAKTTDIDRAVANHLQGIGYLSIRSITSYSVTLNIISPTFKVLKVLSPNGSVKYTFNLISQNSTFTIRSLLPRTDYKFQLYTSTGTLETSIEVTTLIQRTIDLSGTKPEDVTRAIAEYLIANPAAVYATQQGWVEPLFWAAGFFRDSEGVYHARQNWSLQSFEYSGYNDFYDTIFHYATYMAKEKFEFSSGGKEYILWAWKGDYLNLGAGAEMGIYTRMVVNGMKTDHWLVDQSLAMPMTLKVEYNGELIISYNPKIVDPTIDGLKGQSTDKWWVTGFNPDYQDKKASELTATYTATFNTQAMYDDFFYKYGQGNDKDNRWTFDPETITATFNYYKEGVIYE